MPTITITGRRDLNGFTFTAEFVLADLTEACAALDAAYKHAAVYRAAARAEKHEARKAAHNKAPTLNAAGRAALALLVANPLVPRKTLVEAHGLVERSVSFLLEHGYITWNPGTTLFTVLRNE